MKLKSIMENAPTQCNKRRRTWDEKGSQMNIDECWAFLSHLRSYTAAESPLTGDCDWMAKPVVGILMFSPQLPYVLNLRRRVEEGGPCILSVTWTLLLCEMTETMISDGLVYWTDFNLRNWEAGCSDSSLPSHIFVNCELYPWQRLCLAWTSQWSYWIAVMGQFVGYHLGRTGYSFCFGCILIDLSGLILEKGLQLYADFTVHRSTAYLWRFAGWSVQIVFRMISLFPPFSWKISTR